MPIKNIISKSLYGFALFQQYLGKRTDDIGYDKLVKGNKAKCRLTSYEKRLIKELWGKIIPAPLSIGYSFYEMVKSISDFSPDYLPSAYYMPRIFDALNNKSGLKVLGHKGLQSVLFQECEQPRTIISRISGILYDADYKKISVQDALAALNSRHLDMIYKPATDSSMGRGVCLITPGNITAAILKQNDFIIQERVIQSPFMASLNDSSLNCMRLTSINVNGKASVESRIIKVGAKGSVVDNIGGGSGGFVIGVSEDGILADVGYRIDCTKVKSGNSLIFAGRKIPNFQNAIDTVINLHSQRHSMGIIGWDIALDSENKPILIEANSYWPGITMEQLASGPIFGNRTEEVIEYVQRTTARLVCGG